MSEPEGRPLYRLDLPVRWGEMDALGHVNNAVYFRWFEQVRIAWYESLGYPPLADTSETGESMVIVDNHAEYLRPVVYPAELAIRMGGHSPGRSSFISTYTIDAGGELTTRGSSKVIWIDMASGRSTPLPERIRRLLEGTVHV